MANYQDFEKSLLPGNYALTKSMELTKINSSGTLWYTKKFLVLYYYIFLSNDIITREYINKVILHFDRYIKSLDQSVQNAAKKFFYPENQAINFKSKSFKTFSSFTAYNDFNTKEDRQKYLNRAKKNYFALLMNSGAQKGVKKIMKESFQSANYIYTFASVESVLYNAAIRSAVFEANKYHQIKDNSVKYLLSKTAINNIIETSLNQEISIKQAENIVSDFPKENPNYKGIENDVVSFIRNERQVMYYYGYFHSKSSGSNDMEFSSLTPVGEAALTANADEFLAIWEHQKIKMISQPITVDINNILPCVNCPDNFAISYTPYLDILEYIIRNNSMSLDEYKYIVARRKHTITPNNWCEIEPEIKNKLNNIKILINSFNRQGDNRDEDARKELLKYLLGIRCDLSFDNETNPFNFVSINDKKIRVCKKKNKLMPIYEIYSKLNDYKTQKYHRLFERCEQDLKIRYIASCSGNNKNTNAKINPRTKIDWDLYNIHLDKFILLGTFICLAMAKCNFTSIVNLTNLEKKQLIKYCCTHFSTALKFIGLKNNTIIQHEINKFLAAIIEEDYTYFNQIQNNRKEIIVHYRTTNANDLLTRIKQVSAQATVEYAEGRDRNTILIGLLKSYYVQCYLENKNLRCECCNKETFITDTEQPYVEFHHLIPFNIAYGPDHYLNLFALCPNCHTKIHFLNLEDKKELYRQLNINNYMHLTFVNRLITLKEENLLRSYHLEYLLADNAISEHEYNEVIAA